MKDRILLRYARENGGRWYLWFAMSETDWEGGKEFPEIEDNFETSDVWITVDNDEIQRLLDPPEVTADIEGRDGGG